MIVDFDENSAFVYDSDSWGVGRISKDEKGILGRKLNYCLLDLGSVSGRFLEVGCARGQFLRSIKENRPSVEAFGCDINLTALRLNEKAEDGIHYCHADVLRLPFPDGSFHTVVMFDLIEHLYDPEQFLREINRVLSGGGLFHGYIPCEGQPATLHWLSWKLRIGHQLKRKHRGHVQRFTITECRSLLKRAGLTIISERFSGYWLEQALDLLFYVSLEMKNFRNSIWQAHASNDNDERMEKNRIAVRALRHLKNIAYSTGYYESKLLGFLKETAALGLHVTARKVD